MKATPGAGEIAGWHGGSKILAVLARGSTEKVRVGVHAPITPGRRDRERNRRNARTFCLPAWYKNRKLRVH